MKKIILIFAVICFSFLTSNAQWETLNNEFSKEEIKCLSSIENNIVVGTRLGLFISTDNGENWNQKMIETYDSPISSIYVSNNILYVATFGDTTKLWMSKDLGNSWINLNWNSLNKKLLFWKISSIVVNDKKITILIEGANGTQVYSTEDMGKNWMISYTDVELPSGIETIKSNSSWFYMNLPSSDGPWNECYLYRTKVQLDNWRIFKIPSIDGIKLDDGIRSLWLTDSIMYIGTRLGKILSSEDEGITWKLLNKQISIKFVSSIIIDSENRMFAGTQGSGIWVTGNDGYSWLQTKGLPTVNIKDLIISGDYIYATGIPTGMFRAKLSDFAIRTDVQNDQSINSIRIFPNPVTDYIEVDQNIEKYKIYNLSGEIVLESNNVIGYRIELKDLTVGMYFFWCETKDQKIKITKFVKI